MSVELPRWVKIGAIRFAVQRCKIIDKDRSTWGEINYRWARIRIRGNRTIQHQAVSLMHEIIHGALWTLGEHVLCENETFVERLSESLLDTLWHTPGLLRYFANSKK